MQISVLFLDKLILLIESVNDSYNEDIFCGDSK